MLNIKFEIRLQFRLFSIAVSIFSTKTSVLVLQRACSS